MKYLLILLILTSTYFSNAQEFNCQVNVVTDPKLDITSVEQEILEELKQVIFEFMNNTAWTKDEFEVEERINCNLVLQIEDIPSQGVYSGSLQIQSSRPVFNSTYNTTLFNFLDEDVAFRYTRNAILTFAPNEFRDNLTAVLAYYAYMLLGYDYDSFSLEGGSKYFSEAQKIVTLAQTSGGAGWKSNERGKRNRFWLVDNALQELFAPLRTCFYEYHRSGMDQVYTNKNEARTAIYTTLQNLTKVHNSRPGSVNVLNFAQAKLDELKNLYSDAEVKDKNNIVNLLKRIDPANSSKYQEILNS